MSQHPLIEKFTRAGQGQVFAHWSTATEHERAGLLVEAAEIDLQEVERLTRALLRPSAAAGVDLDGLAPAPYERHPANGGERRFTRRLGGG